MRHTQDPLREAARGCDPCPLQKPAPLHLPGRVPILVGCTFVIKGRAGRQPVMKYLGPSDRCGDTEDPPMWEMLKTLLFLSCLPREKEKGCQLLPDPSAQ